MHKNKPNKIHFFFISKPIADKDKRQDSRHTKLSCTTYKNAIKVFYKDKVSKKQFILNSYFLTPCKHDFFGIYCPKKMNAKKYSSILTSLPQNAPMPIEIERKFLVRDNSWKKGKTGIYFCQGYLCSQPERTVRIRIAADKAWLTIKGAATGLARLEFEYAVPVAEAKEILALCPPCIIEKIRYRFPQNGIYWEVDEFLGANSGLTLAEVELEREDQKIFLPTWIGKEVSQDVRYTNAWLAKHPYQDWPAAQKN